MIPVHAGHGAAVGSFFPGEPPPGFHPAPLDLARMAQISYRFDLSGRSTVDSWTRRTVPRQRAHARVVHRAQ